jgi:hypothetical protein
MNLVADKRKPMPARSHSLSIASANHLHSQGHISSAQRDKIHATAKSGLAAARKAPAAGPFGSLSPEKY